MPSFEPALKCLGSRRCNPSICASVFLWVSNCSELSRHDLRKPPDRLWYTGEGSTTAVSSPLSIAIGRIIWLRLPDDILVRPSLVRGARCRGCRPYFKPPLFGGYGGPNVFPQGIEFLPRKRSHRIERVAASMIPRPCCRGDKKANYRPTCLGATGTTRAPCAPSTGNVTAHERAQALQLFYGHGRRNQLTSLPCSVGCVGLFYLQNPVRLFTFHFFFLPLRGWSSSNRLKSRYRTRSTL